MPITFALPDQYPWVLASVTSTAFLNFWLAGLVGSKRKAAGIKYPQAYATQEQVAADPKANVFNCTQRAHLNTVENLPPFVVTTLVAGLKHPRVAAVLGFTWVGSRVIYALGYSTGDPKRREGGAIPGFLALFGLLGTASYSVYQLLAESNFAF